MIFRALDSIINFLYAVLGIETRVGWIIRL